ncbi:DoxX family protein [Massilia oculi]|uniref:DoxX family protein n=1 Tax=Massilia hydrophila TaxID=3044279 RepID=A0ABS7Y7B6_9BURK|nr:DoxX family protein [Massilia oculi]MCA1855580.1 DoxX family protein [Massilia oculi]
MAVTTRSLTGTTHKLDAWFVGKLILIFFRIMLGAWMIVSGASHLLSVFGYPPIFPQPLGNMHPSNVMLVSLLEVGLFDLVKTVELVVGLCLVFNVFVPLALAVALPVSYMVFHNSIALNFRYERIFSTYMAVWCLYMNIILLLAHIRYYLPMLRMRAPMGRLEDLKGLATIFQDPERPQGGR